MSKQRISLNPSSHGRILSRFVLSNRGILDTETAFLNVKLNLSALGNCYWYPRVGAFALIDSLQLLKDGREVSYINNVSQYAALKMLSLCDENDRAKMEYMTKGALEFDIPKISEGRSLPTSNNTNAGNNLSFLTMPQYQSSWKLQSIAEMGNPLLPLSFVLQLLETNRFLNLDVSKYELIITWALSNQYIGNTALLSISSETQLIYETDVSADLVKMVKGTLLPWREVRSASFVLPQLPADESDQQMIPIKFTGFSAEALYIQFSTQSDGWGYNWAAPFSLGDYEIQLLVNNKSLLNRPITQEAVRIYHLERAMAVIKDQPHIAIPAMTQTTYSTDITAGPGYALGSEGGYYRNFQNLMRSFIIDGNAVCTTSPFSYIGFDLRQDGMPTVLDQSGLFLQLTRGASSFEIPVLQMTAFVVGQKTE